MSEPAATTSTEIQPELFALSDVAGFATLTVREQRFVEALMRGQTRADAARDAGVAGSDETIRTAGSRLAAKPRVAAVLNQAWHRTGANIERTLSQAAEIAERAAERLRIATDPRERAQAQREWRDAAALIASIHGKLQLNVTGEVAVAHSHVVLTPEIGEALVAARRRLQDRAWQDRAMAGGAQHEQGPLCASA